MNVVEFTQALVRIPSTSDRLERDAAELVTGRMRAWGWEPVVEEVAPGRPNVVAVVDGGLPGPTLMFEGHTDVVTEGDRGSWTVDPYGAEIRDGRLYGRGSADMKSGVAAMMYGVRALQEAGPFPGRVIVAALADEEGMMLGAHRFAASSLASSVDAAIVCEPEGWEICPVAKGALRLLATFHGRMAHGAMPREGINPLPLAAAFLTEIGAYEKSLQDRFGTHEHLGDVYVTPTVLRAGSQEQLNVIPASATVCLDVRTVPGVDHARVVEDVSKLAGSPVEVLVDRPPVSLEAGHPVVAALASAHASVTGRPVVYGGVPGTTDGTVLTHWGGIPTVVYGPGGKWIAHQANEYVDVTEIETYANVYTEAARLFLTR